MAMPAPQTGMRTAMGNGLGTAMGGGGGLSGYGAVREGKNTEMIYTMIREGRYNEAIPVLSSKLLEFPSSRAAASLLAYCYYYVSDYQNSLQLYERLIKMCPEVEVR